MTIQDGTIKIVSSDDGLNAAGGNDQSSMGRPGENTFQEDSDAYIDILGGTIEIDAKGDGIDSNGDFSVSGGVIYVSVPGMTETELWIMTEQRPSQVEQSLQQA